MWNKTADEAASILILFFLSIMSLTCYRSALLNCVQVLVPQLKSDLGGSDQIADANHSTVVYNTVKQD